MLVNTKKEFNLTMSDDEFLEASDLGYFLRLSYQDTDESELSNIIEPQEDFVQHFSPKKYPEFRDSLVKYILDNSNISEGHSFTHHFSNEDLSQFNVPDEIQYQLDKGYLLSVVLTQF